MKKTKDDVFKEMLQALVNIQATCRTSTSFALNSIEGLATKALESHAQWLKSITMSQEDMDFLDCYFDEIGFIWWEFDNKRIGMSEREKRLMPYRNRLHQLRTDYPEHNLMRRNYDIEH